MYFNYLAIQEAQMRDVNQYYYLVSQLKCPKFCVIAHDLSLEAFYLQSTHLSYHFPKGMQTNGIG